MSNSDYGYGITQKDIDRNSLRMKHLHNEKIRPDGQSFAEFVCEKPFLGNYTDEQKKEYVELVKTVAGFYDNESNQS